MSRLLVCSTTSMREPGAVEFLVTSVVLSIILTVVVNGFLRAFPDASQRAARHLDEITTPKPGAGGDNDSRTRVIVPWKTMILASILLTVLINVLIRIA